MKPRMAFLALVSLALLPLWFLPREPAEKIPSIVVLRAVGLPVTAALSDSIYTYTPDTLAKAHGFRIKRRFEHALRGFSADLTLDQRRALENDPHVAYVESDGIVTTFSQTIPWGIERVGATLSSQRAGDGQGAVSGVRVYVVDTADGFEQNSDLNGAPGPPPPPPVVEGYVADASTGTVITGASVLLYLDPTCPLYPCAWVPTNTNSSGYYSISWPIESGNYLMQASKNGYNYSLKTVSLVVGQQNIVNFNLVPTAPSPTPSSGGIMGTVRRSDTLAPLGGIAVTIPALSLTRTTDSFGSYSFSSVPAGSYSITADAKGYLGQTKTALVVAGFTSQLDFSLFFCANGELGNSGKCRSQKGAAQAEPQSDCVGHATHVAGTAGAIDNDQLVVGVAPGAELVAVKVFQGCLSSTSVSDIIAGLDWIIANGQKPAVVNMSLGGPYSQALYDATVATKNAGFVVAVAAGNSAADACGVTPAAAGGGVDNGIITVAATDSSDNEASWSNYGKCVDLWAPGVGIESTCNTGGTCTLSGTSMSSPHVAGAAALYFSTHPSAAPTEVEQVIRLAARIPGAKSKDGRAILILDVRTF